MKKDYLKGKEIDIHDGQSTVYFTGGEDGKDYEIGTYCFWTAIGEDDYGPWRVIGRALARLPAADRFQRMDQDRLMSPDGQDRAAYQMIWDRFDTAQYIRPASLREIVEWFSSHKEEGKYAQPFAIIGGEKRDIPRSMV